jgi:hypothetical protein
MHSKCFDQKSGFASSPESHASVKNEAVMPAKMATAAMNRNSGARFGGHGAALGYGRRRRPRNANHKHRRSRRSRTIAFTNSHKGGGVRGSPVGMSAMEGRSHEERRDRSHIDRSEEEVRRISVVMLSSSASRRYR